MKIEIFSEGERGTKKLQRKFTRLASKIGNRRQLMNRIGIQILNQVAENFRQEGNDGEKWPPLSPFTLARRRNKDKSTVKILQDAGELRRSFARKYTNDEVRVGTQKIYAPPHEFGETLKSIPQRKILPSQKRGLEIAISVAEHYILQARKQSFGGSGGIV